MQQPNIINGLGQIPITDPVIPPLTRTTLQPTSVTPSAQQQGQKNKKIIKLGTDLISDLFITSTFIVPELQRRLREVGKGRGEDSIIIPREPSLSPYMGTSIFNNNNNSKKREEENLL